MAGRILLGEVGGMTRLAVFVDYQNLYHGAREAFGNPERDPPTMGHLRPQRLGLLLEQLGESVDSNRELCSVTVYRGQPGPKDHKNLRSAFDRQVAAWRSLPTIAVKTRPLRYRPVEWAHGRPSRWRGEEKGIDVQIALDIAIGAWDDSYDVAVVASADSDLVPALEAALTKGKRVETATWFSPRFPRRPLTVPGRRTWNHWLNRQHYELLHDDTDYLLKPTADPP